MEDGTDVNFCFKKKGTSRKKVKEKSKEKKKKGKKLSATLTTVDVEKCPDLFGTRMMQIDTSSKIAAFQGWI